MSRILLIAALCVATATLSAQSRLTSTLDSIAASGVAARRTPGMVVAVVKGNDTLLLKGYGQADVEWNVPMPADAMFELGSLTKQFTAAAILQLRDAGKLSLDDDITKWLPDFNTRGNKVPLRRLLDHTSGIVGITEMPEFGILATNTAFPRDSAYALINRYPFQFPTGEAQIYNNSAFWLLGLIVEQASGMSYENYIEQKIFAPLGMTHSSYCRLEENVPKRAHGYQVTPLGYLRAATNIHTWPFSAGSLCSTAGDLVIWLEALHGGKVLTPKSYAEMITPARLNDGTVTRYAMGIGVGRDARGLSFIGHGGAIGGFTTEATWYPEARLAIVVLMNSNGTVSPAAVAEELAGAILPWTRPTMAAFTGDVAPLVGRYRGPARGREMTVEITRTAEGIAASVNGSPPRALGWVEGLQFRTANSFLTFRAAQSGGPVTELRFDAGPGSYMILKKQ